MHASQCPKLLSWFLVGFCSRKSLLQSEKLGEMLTLCLHGSGVAVRRGNVGG
ncbi:hypothetical protein Hanom_Chr16g01464611 [Helianthus anomalus]